MCTIFSFPAYTRVPWWNHSISQRSSQWPHAFFWWPRRELTSTISLLRRLVSAACWLSPDDESKPDGGEEGVVRTRSFTGSSISFPIVSAANFAIGAFTAAFTTIAAAAVVSDHSETAFWMTASSNDSEITEESSTMDIYNPFRPVLSALLINALLQSTSRVSNASITVFRQHQLLACPVYWWLFISIPQQFCEPLIKIIFRLDGDGVFLESLTLWFCCAFGVVQYLLALASLSYDRPQILCFHHVPASGFWLHSMKAHSVTSQLSFSWENQDF